VEARFESLIQQAGRARAAQERRRATRWQRNAHERWVEQTGQMLDLRDADERAMDDCLMREQAVRGKALTPGQCWRCGKPLPPRARRWCSMVCVTAWVTNHTWTMARDAALKRDRHTCQTCGAQTGWQCDCGEFFLGVWRYVWQARSKHQNANPGHRMTYVDARLEVNHKTPRAGKGYDKGCHHHLDGLETLCHACHVRVTKQQRRERSDARLAARVRELGFDPQTLLPTEP
jgi:5-methylcytosine-specific restriction endonuclease McrA